MNNESAWIVPYGNLMTILMIFFLLLYAYTYLTGKVRYEKVVASLTEGFGRSAPSREVELAEYLEGYFSSRQEYLRNMDMDSERIKLVFNLPVFFAPGSVDIKESAAVVLDDIFKIMHDLPNEIVISGFSGPTSSGNEMLISAGRALKIGQRFIKKGIDPQRIILKGWGAASSGDRDKSSQVSTPELKVRRGGLKVSPGATADFAAALDERVEISIMREVSPPDIPVSEKLTRMKENYFYGDYYYKKGDLKKARLFFECILDLDPSHWKARRMIKRIKKEQKLKTAQQLQKKTE
ncbi:MAG: OmpA family protein [Elusimicrobiota bacterium]|nr:OmpA family protein [Elusimicrobiota bacterium]